MTAFSLCGLGRADVLSRVGALHGCSVSFTIDDCLELSQHVFRKRWLPIPAYQFVDPGTSSREDVARWLRAARAAINDRGGKMLLLPKKRACFLQLEKFSGVPDLREHGGGQGFTGIFSPRASSPIASPELWNFVTRMYYGLQCLALADTPRRSTRHQ